jgi:hypothetical protein
LLLPIAHGHCHVILEDLCQLPFFKHDSIIEFIEQSFLLEDTRASWGATIGETHPSTVGRRGEVWLIKQSIIRVLLLHYLCNKN